MNWTWWAAGGAVVGGVALMLKPKRDSSRLERALPAKGKPYAGALLESAARHAPPGIVTVERFAELLGAVIDHESRWGDLLTPRGPGGKGDGGNGLGIGQIDRRHHGVWATTAAWWDPVVNIDKAAEVLAAKFRRFPGNVAAALASYNASEDRVARAVAEGKDPQTVTTRGAYVDEVGARLALMQKRATT